MANLKTQYFFEFFQTYVMTTICFKLKISIRLTFNCLGNHLENLLKRLEKEKGQRNENESMQNAKVHVQNYANSVEA